MKLFTSLFVMTVISLAAHADQGQLFGKWGMSVSQNGWNFHMTFDIQPHQTLVSNVCTYNGQSLTAAIIVATEATDTEYTIKESKQNEVNNGPMNCQVSAQAASGTYFISGNTLTLVDKATGETAQFARE